MGPPGFVVEGVDAEDAGDAATPTCAPPAFERSLEQETPADPRWAEVAAKAAAQGLDAESDLEPASPDSRGEDRAASPVLARSETGVEATYAPFFAPSSASEGPTAGTGPAERAANPLEQRCRPGG